MDRIDGSIVTVLFPPTELILLYGVLMEAEPIAFLDPFEKALGIDTSESVLVLPDISLSSHRVDIFITPRVAVDDFPDVVKNAVFHAFIEQCF